MTGNDIKDICAYEVLAALNKVKKHLSDSADYFCGITEEYYKKDTIIENKPDIIVIGTVFPREILEAFDLSYLYIQGGSFSAAVQCDSIVPRDIDPVSRSALGFITYFNTLAEKALIIIPIISDGTRKIAYLLRYNGYKVLTIEIPADKSNHNSLEIWKAELENCIEEIKKHTGKRFKKKNIIKASELYKKADSLKKLLIKNNKISGLAKMFLLYSFYLTDNIKKWNENLEMLLIKQKDKNIKNENNILIIGSPILFPNYKIPVLAEKAGLNITANIDYTNGCLFSKEKGLLNLYEDFYINDCSSAYINNDCLYKNIKGYVKNNKIDGVIYHILKGQIEYDFELEKYENFFEALDIPIFRLETDYSQNDKEQIKIRLEAFKEMILQRKYKGGTVYE